MENSSLLWVYQEHLKKLILFRAFFILLLVIKKKGEGQYKTDANLEILLLTFNCK